MTKKALILGSSGMVGSLVLSNCLESKKVDKVITINRKSQNMKHPKLTEVLHKDFYDFSKCSKHFQNIDVAYYCIGVYTGQFDDEKFKKITVDMTKEFANTLIKNSPKATVCFLSGEGADRTEKSKISFARYKGMAENYLNSLEFKSLNIFRPGYIYPVKPRIEPNFSYKIFRKLAFLLRLFYPNGMINSTDLAKFMFEVGLNSKKTIIFNNKAMKEYLQ